MSEDQAQYDILEKFSGFPQPEQNFSKLPHVFIDLLSEIDSLAELKVTLYVLRHTWGFSEYDKPKKITTDEFEHGRKKRDGSRMDNGTGLSTNSVRAGLEKAVERGTLTVEVDESDKARIEKRYCLNMRDDSNFESRPAKVAPRPAKVDHRTEKETIERKELGANAPDTPLDWQIASGGEIVQPDQFPAKARDAAGLIDMQCSGGGALAEAFMLERKIIIPDAKIKGNRKAAREMLEMGVKPEHVKQAVVELVKKGMTVIDLFSISKTAIDLANKPEKKIEKLRLL